MSYKSLILLMVGISSPAIYPSMPITRHLGCGSGNNLEVAPEIDGVDLNLVDEHGNLWFLALCHNKNIA